MPTKSILESKTFWIAAIQALVGASIVFSTAYPGIGWIVLGKSLLDVVLRLLTEQPAGF